MTGILRSAYRLEWSASGPSSFVASAARDAGKPAPALTQASNGTPLDGLHWD